MTFPYSSDIIIPQYPEDTRFVPVSSLFCENTTFSKSSTDSLIRSIERNGFFEPLYIDETNRVIDGAKRLCAAKILSLGAVCVINRRSEKSFFDSLVEIIKNEKDIFKAADLLLFASNELCVSRDVIARELSLGTSAVSNKIRLASFGDDERALFRSYRLCERQARALLKTKGALRLTAIKHIGENSLNVAQTEEYIDSLVSNRKSTSPIHQFEKNLFKLCDNASSNGLQNSIIKRETSDEIIFTIRIAE